MKKIHIAVILLFITMTWTTQGYGQQVQKAVKGTFLLKGGTLHTMSRGTMVSDLLVKDGRIANIGSIPVTSDVKVIDCSGQHIYPGFIDGGTRLGLTEVESVSLTQDYNELGDFIPHMQALTAVNPNSVSIPVTRTNGVTTVISKPSGGLFPGTAALIDLQGYTPEKMYAGFKGVILNFPTTGKRSRWDRRTEEEIKKESEKNLKKLNDTWKKAKLYARIDSTAKAQRKVRDDYNPQMDALLPIIRGEAAIMIETNKRSDILSAIKWAKKQGIKQVILTGVEEGYKVTKELLESGYPVITGPMLSVPKRTDARFDVAYANAGAMMKAGIPVALRTNEAENVRNLPFNAGFAATYGMGREEALRAITIVPAEILGIDKDYGSLDVGKVANIVVSEGDPFEPRDKVVRLFIRGYDVPLESRHTLLYEEFLNREGK